jgi:hypothetical protein
MPVDRVSSTEPLHAGRPVVLSGALAGSDAVRDWSIARLRAEHGDAEVGVRVSDENAPQLFAGDPQRAFRFERMPLADVIDGFGRAGAPKRYVQLCDLRRTLPRLAERLPTPSQAGALYAEGPYAWICGGGTVNPLHFDFNEALIGQIAGEKRFLLFPPTDSAKIAGRVERAVFRTTSLDFQNPDRARFPRLGAAQGYEATVVPGDVLYVPCGWWHAMVAPDPSISVTWWWEPSHTAHAVHTIRQRSADALKRVLRALRVT